MIAKILLGEKSIGGVRFSVNKSIFPKLILPDPRYSGTFKRWSRVADRTINIEWDDEQTDIMALHELLLPLHELTLENYKGGKAAPRLKGAARVEHAQAEAAAVEKEVVRVEYKDGALTKVQWSGCTRYLTSLLLTFELRNVSRPNS